MASAAATDWIEWTGGEQPVVGSVKVQLRHEAATRDEIDADRQDIGDADLIDWSHDGFQRGWEVVAYRVVQS